MFSVVSIIFGVLNFIYFLSGGIVQTELFFILFFLGIAECSFFLMSLGVLLLFRREVWIVRVSFALLCVIVINYLVLMILTYSYSPG